MNVDAESDPSESYVAPPRQWKGSDCAIYSLGNRMLVAMITLPEDLQNHYLLTVLFVLTNPREKVQRLTQDRDAARMAVLEFIDSVGDEMDIACNLAAEIIKEGTRDKVDPITTAQAGNV